VLRAIGQRSAIALTAAALLISSVAGAPLSPVALSPRASVSHCDSNVHCYAINIQYSDAAYIKAAGADVWNTCLYLAAPYTGISTHEMWMHTNAQAGVTTWIEIGLIVGLAAGSSAQFPRWFWGDYRGTWDNFNQHVLSSVVDYTRHVSVYYTSGYNWDVFLNGVYVGTSSPNGNQVVQSEVGDETTTAAGAYSYGAFADYKVRRGTTWYNAVANQSVHYPPYYYAFSGPTNFYVSTVNRCGTSALQSAPQEVAAGPISEAQAVETAKQVAAANGEPSPADGVVTKSRRQAAQKVVAGANVDSDEDVYLVELHGQFVGYMASVPAGAPLPRGGTVVVTIGSETGEILDWSLGDRRADLSKLGETTAFSF
jgi:hypothetical protein